MARIGKVTILMLAIKEPYEELALLQKDMVVLHIEESFRRGEVVYYAIHPDFEEVAPHCVTPEYLAIFNRDDSGNLSLRFEKHEPEMLLSRDVKRVIYEFVGEDNIELREELIKALGLAS